MNWNEYFEYDSTSPTFIRNKITRSPRAKQGAPAGTFGKDCIAVNFQGKIRAVSRIVWELHHGKIPEGMLIMFKDGNCFNLDISNLALQTRRRKGLNSNQPVSNSGKRGIGIVNGKCVVRAKINGVCSHLGSYNSIVDAERARKTLLKFIKD